MDLEVRLVMTKENGCEVFLDSLEATILKAELWAVHEAMLFIKEKG